MRKTAFIILNEELEDIMKIVKSLKEIGLLIWRISETIKDEAKNQNGGFLSMILKTVAPSILETLLKRKRVIGHTF